MWTGKFGWRPNNTRLQVRVSLLRVGVNVLHLSISLFRETLRRRLENHHESEDKEIQPLSKTLPFIIESRLVATTNKKYFRGWKNWVDSSKRKRGVISNPADPFYVAMYLKSCTLHIRRQRFNNHCVLRNKMGSSYNGV